MSSAQVKESEPSRRIVFNVHSATNPIQELTICRLKLTNIKIQSDRFAEISIGCRTPYDTSVCQMNCWYLCTSTAVNVFDILHTISTSFLWALSLIRSHDCLCICVYVFRRLLIILFIYFWKIPNGGVFVYIFQCFVVINRSRDSSYLCLCAQ